MPNPLSYPEPSIQNSLNILSEFLEEHSNWQTPHKYIIIEYFPSNKLSNNYEPKIYELINLEMEIEDGMIVFSDVYEDILKDNTRVLNAFLVDSILYIGFQTCENTITISFNDGFIRIFY